MVLPSTLVMTSPFLIPAAAAAPSFTTSATYKPFNSSTLYCFLTASFISRKFTPTYPRCTAPNSLKSFTIFFTKLRSEEHTSELQSRENLVCRLLLEKKNKQQ